MSKYCKARAKCVGHIGVLNMYLNYISSRVVLEFNQLCGTTKDFPA